MLEENCQYHSLCPTLSTQRKEGAIPPRLESAGLPGPVSGDLTSVPY